MVTVLLLIAGVVCSMVLLNAVYPAITGSSGAIVDAASKIDDRIRSNISIIQISDSGNVVYIWIKNVGASSIVGISKSDVFFGPQGNFTRIIFQFMTCTMRVGNRYHKIGFIERKIIITSIPEYYITT